MKVCFPVKDNKGLESEVYGHFGSAPMFIVFNTETKEISPIDNSDLGHIHGMCSPIKALGGEVVDIVIVGGIGSGAVSKLNSMNIKVYKAQAKTVKENIDLLEKSQMEELTVAHACGGHSHGNGCEH